MVRAVLFDLDGTLLDIVLDSFLREYFCALGPVVARVAGNGVTEQEALDAVISGTQAMSADHPTLTNRVLFNQRFHELTGCDLAQPEHVAVIERFYREVFPELQGPHGPRAGGVEAVLTARDAGMSVVLATNPIFPLMAIQERMRWAAVDESWFHAITSYETSVACKPSPTYYRQIADELCLDPGECLMVGDDPVLDMAAGDVGMKTFYVGAGSPPTADWHGDLSDVRRLLLSLAHRE